MNSHLRNTERGNACKPRVEQAVRRNDNGMSDKIV